MVEYEEVEHIVTMGTTPSGLTKEVNLISWGGAYPKYDIRTWNRDSEGRQMYKGITLTEEEMIIMVKALVKVIMRERGE